MRPLFNVVFVPSTPMKEGKAFDRGVLENDIGKRPADDRAMAAKETFCGPSRRKDDAGVLNGEKSFRNVDVEKDCADERGDQ